MTGTEAILLVDDDEDHLLIARRALERGQMGAEILLAHDGNEALKILGLDGSEQPHASAVRVVAVMLDLRMPGLSGWEILRRIRANDRTKQVPVVVVSSSNRPDDVMRSYSLGANSYLVKRFDPDRPGGYLADAARYWLHMNEAPVAVSNRGNRAAE